MPWFLWLLLRSVFDAYDLKTNKGIVDLIIVLHKMKVALKNLRGAFKFNCVKDNYNDIISITKLKKLERKSKLCIKGVRESRTPSNFLTTEQSKNQRCF